MAYRSGRAIRVALQLERIAPARSDLLITFSVTLALIGTTAVAAAVEADRGVQAVGMRVVALRHRIRHRYERHSLTVAHEQDSTGWFKGVGSGRCSPGSIGTTTAQLRSEGHGAKIRDLGGTFRIRERVTKDMI